MLKKKGLGHTLEKSSKKIDYESKATKIVIMYYGRLEQSDKQFIKRTFAIRYVKFQSQILYI